MDERLNIALSLIIFLAVGSVLAYSPRDVRVVREYARFQEAFQGEEYGEMSEHLAQIARYLPCRPELWDKAGQFARLAGEDQHARRYFERARSLDVLSRDGYLSLGEIYREQGESARAIEVWSEIPATAAAARKKARLYHQLGQYQAAIRSWENYLSLVDTAGTDVHFTLGLLLAAEDPLQALPHLDLAAPDYPQARILQEALTGIEDQEPAYRLVVAGQRLGSLGRWTLASHAFQQALELRPDYSQAWAYWGEALQQVPEPDKDPLRALEHALELDPESSLANIFLGTYWQRQGEHQKALSYFEGAREMDPDNPDIYVELGRSLAVIGDLQESLEQFRKAIQLRPDSPDYYRLLAQFTGCPSGGDPFGRVFAVAGDHGAGNV